MGCFSQGFGIDPSMFPRFSEFSDLEKIALSCLLLYFLFGAVQLLRIPGVKRYIRTHQFPDKNYFVSLIVPIHQMSSALERSLESFCKQDYPNYELIFVIQNKDDPSHQLARRFAEQYPIVRVTTVEEPHDPKRCVAKAHNLLQGVAIAKGEVYLFSDSDVPHQKNWMRQMISPLGEELKGRQISGTTAVFLMEAEGFVGNFSALTTNQATILSSFTNKEQDFPAFASGASVAVLKSVFHELKVEAVWANTFNDDLTLANTLVKNGHHVYNVRSLLTRPVEEFDNFGELFTKMRRWVLTIQKYFHPDSRRLVWKLLATNFQFPVGIDLVLLFLILGHLGYLDSSAGFLLLVVVLSYSYVVIFRAVLGMMFKERNVMKYVLLTPFSFFVWGTIYLFLPFFCHSFSWGGIEYDISEDRYRES